MTWATAREIALDDNATNQFPQPTFKVLLESFRSTWRRDQATKSNASRHHAFPTLGGVNPPAPSNSNPNANSNSSKQRTCLCGDTKVFRWEKCPYISPKVRAKGWTPNPEIAQQIANKISKMQRYDRAFFVTKFGYDGPEPTATKTTDTSNRNELLGSYVAKASFGGVLKQEYKLYNSQLLDNASDTHICNNPRRAHWSKQRNAQPGDVVISGKQQYDVEAFGTVHVNIQTPEGKAVIELRDVALVPGYMTNVVALKAFNRKGVHWNSEHPDRLTTKGKTFCYLYPIGEHWVLEKDSPLSEALPIEAQPTSADVANLKYTQQTSIQEVKGQAYSAKTSNRGQVTSYEPRKATLTAELAHQIFGHVQSKSIDHLANAVQDISIDYSTPCPTTLECTTCGISKATEQVSRRTGTESVGIPGLFDSVSWDLIDMSPGYNGDQYLSHFECLQTGFTMVYALKAKGDSFDNFDE